MAHVLDHQYEFVVLLRPDATDEQTKQAIARVEEIIKKEGGTVTATEPWGRRRLTFILKKQREASYVLLRVTAEPAAVLRLQNAFRMEDNVLRLMITRAEEGGNASPVAPGRLGPSAFDRQDWA